MTYQKPGMSILGALWEHLDYICGVNGKGVLLIGEKKGTIKNDLGHNHVFATLGLALTLI